MRRSTPDPRASSWRSPGAPAAGSTAPSTSAAAASSSGTAASRWASLAPSRTPADGGRSDGPGRAPAESRWAPRQAPNSLNGSRWSSEPGARSNGLRNDDRSVSRDAGGPVRKAGTDINRDNGLRRRADGDPLGGLVDQMALLASPSRGLDDASAAIGTDGSGNPLSLMDAGTQDQFRSYISERIRSHRKRNGLVRCSCSLSPTAMSDDLRSSLEQIGLLIRKLREALMAARRIDDLTLNTYMLSVLVSILTNNEGQLASALPRLTEELLPWLTIRSEAWSTSSRSLLRDDLAMLVDAPDTHSINFERASAADLLDVFSSLYLLKRTTQFVLPGRPERAAVGRASAASTISEALKLGDAMQSELASVPGGGRSRYLAQTIRLARSIRQCNVAAFRAQVVHPSEGAPWTHWHLTLIRRAVASLETEAWRRLRASYLSVTLPAYTLDPGGAAQETTAWLERTLLLDTEVQAVDAEGQSAVSVRAQRLASALQRHGLATKDAAAAKSMLHPDAAALAPWAGATSPVSMSTPHAAVIEAAVDGRALTLRVR